MRLNRSVFSGLQRSVATILTIALPLYTASAYAVPPGDDTPRNPPAEGQRTATETPGAAVPMGELSNEAGGKVKVTEWKDNNGHRQKVRLDVEDATIAERMEIDGKRGAIEIAGVSFRPVTDPATGRPSAVVVGDAVEEATYVVSGQTAQPGSESDQRAMERISKRFNAANGSARIAHMKDVMQSVMASKGAAGRVRGMANYFDCTMDIIALVMDWVNVVLVCGATLIVLVFCIAAIVWATFDTLHEVFAIGSDCV